MSGIHLAVMFCVALVVPCRGAADDVEINCLDLHPHSRFSRAI